MTAAGEAPEILLRRSSGKQSTLMFAPSRVRHENFSLALASVSFEWPPLCKAGGTVNETTVDHALIRGLGTAGPDASWSCLGLGSSVGWNARLIVDTRVLLP